MKKSNLARAALASAVVFPIAIGTAMCRPSSASQHAYVMAATTGTLRMLPIGDSITQGGKHGVKEYTYRWPLARMLADEGARSDFIGSRTSGLNADATWPAAWDSHHEGYYGATTATVRDKLRISLPTLPPPDIALVDLGTNDAGADVGTAIVSPLRDSIAALRARSPRVVVLVAQIKIGAVKGA